MRDCHNYTVNVFWLEDHQGIIESAALEDKIEVATPPEFTGGHAGIWSPEHLFIGAATSCYMTTFLAVAEKSRLEFANFKCHASGMIENINGQWMMSQIILQPVATVTIEKDIAKAMKVLELSHRSCPILHSMKSHIALLPRVTVLEHKEEKQQ